MRNTYYESERWAFERDASDRHVEGRKVLRDRGAGSMRQMELDSCFGELGSRDRGRARTPTSDRTLRSKQRTLSDETFPVSFSIGRRRSCCIRASRALVSSATAFPSLTSKLLFILDVAVFFSAQNHDAIFFEQRAKWYPTIGTLS